MSRYNVVNMSNILCGSKGLSPTGEYRTTSSDVSVSTSTSPSPTTFQSNYQDHEIILGIKWYYRFVIQKKSASLMSEVTDLKTKFLVCMNYPIPPYVTRHGKTKDTRRLFAAFNNPYEFWTFANKINPEKWHFFEYILENHAQKIYFDIDIHPPDNNDEFVNRLINGLVGRIVDFFHRKQYALDLNRNLLWFHSNSEDAPEKRSYHLIINGYGVNHCKETEAVVNEILDGFPDEYRKYIDSTMYSSKQQFRLYKSRKARTNRPKVFMPKWQYGLKTIEYAFPDLPYSLFGSGNEAEHKAHQEQLQDTFLFAASCVTMVEGCYIMPIHTNFENMRLPRIANEEDEFLGEQITDEVVQELIKRIDPVVFQIYEYPKATGTLMRINRIRPAICSLCTPPGGPDRIHEGDNAFLRVNSTGNVYFYCWRNHNVSKWVANISDLLTLEDRVSDQQTEEFGKTLPSDVNVGALNKFFDKPSNPIRPIKLASPPNPLVITPIAQMKVEQMVPLVSNSLSSPNLTKSSNLPPGLPSGLQSGLQSGLPPGLQSSLPPGLPINPVKLSGLPIISMTSSKISPSVNQIPVIGISPITNSGNNQPISLKSLKVRGQEAPVLMTYSETPTIPQLNSLRGQMHDLATKRSKLVYGVQAK